MELSLASKTILIVGGTGGLGLSAARAFIGAGARVFLVGRSEGKLAEAVAQLGPAACGGAGDAADPAAMESAFEKALHNFGALDGLYHVAGGSGRRHGDGPLHELTAEGIDYTLGQNLKSVLHSNRLAAAYFVRTGRTGAVVNMASVLGYSPAPRHFATHAYAACKAGIIGLTRAAAALYAPQGIRFNVVAPGLVDTPMAQRAMHNEEILRYLRTKQPLDGGRAGVPEDLDAAAVWLMSDAARFVTGQVIGIDGGWSVSEGQYA